MAEGPEHRPGWRHYFEQNGRRYEIVAAHGSRLRPYSPSKVALPAGQLHRPFEMIEEVTYEWVIIQDGQPLHRLLQYPRGAFGSGPYVFRRMPIVEAAQALVRRSLADKKPANST